jgi:hypothetical protein
MSSKNIPKILIAVPVYHSVQPEPFIRFLIFSQYTGYAETIRKYEVRWCVPGPKMKTIIARNTASHTAIEGGADFLLLIDDDMVVVPGLIDKLLVHDVDIVSPLFFRSTPPIEPLIFDIDELGNYVPIYDYPENALFETPGGSGTGVMLIKTEVLKAMDIPIWGGSAGLPYGEDVEFCKRARELGFRSWCDSSIKIGQMSLPVSVGEQQYLVLTEKV